MMPGEPRSVNRTTRFSAYSTGRLPTTSIVGSLGTGVRGSSEGWSTMPVALTTPWFEMIVPSGVFGFTTTLKVMVATLAGVLDASAGIETRVGSAGGLIGMPFTSGDAPATTATAAPVSVVLPAT